MPHSTPSAPAAVVLLSGGLDSATTFAEARHRGFAVHTLAIDYGQRHRIELTRAAEIAARGGAITHRVVSVDLRAIGGSALTADIAVPQGRDEAAIGTGIPSTYVPARNTIFLSIALGLAETLPAFDLFLGANVLDYSGYPDCRPEFLSAFEHLAGVATRAGVEGTGRFRIHAPLLRMTKAEIIRRGIELGVDYSQTISCYSPDEAGRSCGMCDSCFLRKKGFRDAGVQDPTVYVDH